MVLRAAPFTFTQAVNHMDGTSSIEAAEAQQLYSLIKRHAWIMQCWLTNFCCNSYWERLPESWREALLSLSDEEMQELPAGLHPPTTWPPELRELVLTAQQLAPPTQAELDASVERVSPMLLDGIPHVRNMGPKKQHEVLRLAPVVAREAARCGASTVVDLGSGHGYLSHVLAFHHGLHVIGIECAAHNCAAAHHRAWMVREKLRDVKFRVSNPKAPTKAQLKMAELSAHVALGGGEKVRAEAAPRACKCSLRRPTSPQVRAEAARAEEANAAASAHYGASPPHRYAPRRPVRRKPMRRRVRRSRRHTRRHAAASPARWWRTAADRSPTWSCASSRTRACPGSWQPSSPQWTSLDNGSHGPRRSVAVTRAALEAALKALKAAKALRAALEVRVGAAARVGDRSRALPARRTVASDEL